MKKNITNKQFVIGFVVSLLLFVSWNFYTNYIDATITYEITTQEIREKKSFQLTIPYFRHNLSVNISSQGEKVCGEYLENENISVNLYFDGQKYSLNKLNLNNLKYKNLVIINISTEESLKDCKIYLRIEDTALDLFLFIVFAYIPVMLFIASLLILIFREIRKKIRNSFLYDNEKLFNEDKPSNLAWILSIIIIVFYIIIWIL